MRALLLTASVMLLAGATGCGGGSGEEAGQGTSTGGGSKLLVDAPPPAAGGVQLLSPTFKVAAGKEVFECLRVPFDAKEDIFVQASHAWQTKGGHHTMLYYSDSSVKYDDAPHECDGTDMLDVRFVGVGTATGGGITMPPGVALRIPAGVRMYAQSHYLNTTDHEIEVQDAVNLDLIPKDKVENVAGAFTEINSQFDLAPQKSTDATVTCSPQLEGYVPWMIPHMHEYGQHFKLELISKGKTSTLYESDWEETLRDHFPLVTFDPHLKVSPDDKIKTTCTWKNTTAKDLTWPREMCATFMIEYPSPDGLMWACDVDGNNFKP